LDWSEVDLSRKDQRAKFKRERRETAKEIQTILPALAGFSQSQQLFSKVRAFTIEIDADRGTHPGLRVLARNFVVTAKSVSVNGHILMDVRLSPIE
jgi:hypothetical protein